MGKGRGKRERKIPWGTSWARISFSSLINWATSGINSINPSGIKNTPKLKPFSDLWVTTSASIVVICERVFLFAATSSVSPPKPENSQKNTKEQRKAMQNDSETKWNG